MWQKALQLSSGGGYQNDPGLYKLVFNRGWNLTNPNGKTTQLPSNNYEDEYILVSSQNSLLTLKDSNRNYLIYNISTDSVIVTKGNSNNYWTDIGGTHSIIIVEDVDYNKIP